MPNYPPPFSVPVVPLAKFRKINFTPAPMDSAGTAQGYGRMGQSGGIWSHSRRRYA